MAKKKQNIIFPQYISTTDRTVSIVGYVDTKKKDLKKEDFIDGKGYIDNDGTIYIYAQIKPKYANQYPYFWITDEGVAEKSSPEEIMIKAFNIDRLVDMNLRNIIDTTDPNEVLFNEEEINNIISSASFYIPEIKEDDDFLKKIIKYTIIKKKIDINRLKNKTDEKYVLPNMKAALNSSTKTSVIYFALWMDLLGCDFDIIISDAGEDKVDPLKSPIAFSSHTGKLGDLINGEFVENPSVNNFKDEEDE